MDKFNTLKIIASYMGSRHAYAMPVAFYKAAMLEHFYTDSYAEDILWLKYLAKLFSKIPHPKVVDRFLLRNSPELPKEKVTSFISLGAQFYLLRLMSKTRSNLTATRLWAGKKLCKKVISSGLGKANAVYAFNGFALELFKFAKERNIKRILEQVHPPIIIEEYLLKKEYFAQREWLHSGWQEDSYSQQFAEREKQEWDLADLIIGASEFTKQNLLKMGVDSSLCKIIPYGVNSSLFNRKEKKEFYDKNLKVLFVGNICIRKGIPYLMQALKILNSSSITLRLVGSLSIKKERLKEYSKYCRIMGFVPKHKLLENYQWADIFVFPSLYEGFGLVMLEALAFGLPVITTPNGASVVRDGVDGFIVPIRDAEAIADRIDRLARDRELLRWMSQNARKRALDFSWDAYEKRLVSTINREILPLLSDI